MIKQITRQSCQSRLANWYGRDTMRNKIPRAQTKIRLALSNACLSCSWPPASIQPSLAATSAPCPSLPASHSAAESKAQAQRWGWEPHSHFVPPPPQQNRSSPQLLLSPTYAPAAFTCTLPLCKVLLRLLMYCTNPKLLCFTIPQSWLYKTQPHAAENCQRD